MSFSADMECIVSSCIGFYKMTKDCLGFIWCLVFCSILFWLWIHTIMWLTWCAKDSFIIYIVQWPNISIRATIEIRIKQPFVLKVFKFCHFGLIFLTDAFAFVCWIYEIIVYTVMSFFFQAASQLDWIILARSWLSSNSLLP